MSNNFYLFGNGGSFFVRGIEEEFLQFIKYIPKIVDRDMQARIVHKDST